MNPHHVTLIWMAAIIAGIAAFIWAPMIFLYGLCTLVAVFLFHAFYYGIYAAVTGRSEGDVPSKEVFPWLHIFDKKEKSEKK